MNNNTQIQIICNRDIINNHSDGGKHYGWNNPIDALPPVGSIIKYIDFNGDKVLYQVEEYHFITEETSNHSFCNKICKIFVNKI